MTEIPSEIYIEDAVHTAEEEVKDSVEEDIQTTDESHLIEDENQFNNELDNDDEDDDEDINTKIRRLEVIISEMSFDEKEVSSEQVDNETSTSEIEADNAEEQDEENQDFEAKTEIEGTVSGDSDAQQKENTTEQAQEEQLNYFEWIKQSSKNSVDASNELETEEQERKYALLDAFLERNPKIVPSDEIKEIDIDAASSIEDNNLITETMAQLYMGQKQFKKAIEAYKTLILKYPEKVVSLPSKFKKPRGLLIIKKTQNEYIFNFYGFNSDCITFINVSCHGAESKRRRFIFSLWRRRYSGRWWSSKHQ